MTESRLTTTSGGEAQQEKILLVLLPYWTPQIPPLGISCLKSYLQNHGFETKTVDVNIEKDFREAYDKYFQLLRTHIPAKERGNFVNIGHDVWRNHMMAHINHTDEEEYFSLVEVLVERIFFRSITREQVMELEGAVVGFYRVLERYFLDLLEKEKPTVLGLSVFSGNLPASLFAARLAKQHNPETMVVFGGGIFANQLGEGTPNLETFLENSSAVDHVIMGEGELLFLKLLQGELPRSQRVFGLQDISFQTLDLKAVDIPDFSDFNLLLYPHLSHYASRSCPFQCNFCSETAQWGKYRRKDAAQLVDELIKLYRQYGTQLFLLGDSLLNPIVDSLADELIKAGVSIYWDGYLRVDKKVLETDNTMHWRRSGLYRARLGVESGSQRVLDLMTKKITTEQIRLALASLGYAGIKTTTYWLIGYPGETEEDFQQTLDIIEEMKNDIYEAEGNPFIYFYKGQILSDTWQQEFRCYTLYPEKFSDMLVTQSWAIDCDPSREVVYDRVRRFVAHCRRLGVPNPYTMKEIYDADERWKKLHKNGVPSVVDFKNGFTCIDEHKSVREFSHVKSIASEDGDFLLD
jgi:radical SAM superfamily enzyme YgiQ (UPF0313 family)